MRITGGRFRSRVLRAPKGDETRPTSDRVREALFSMLESRRGGVARSRVLDLYAGTGALGLEALSRGAEHVTFVERRREALAALRENVEALAVNDVVRVVARAVEAADLGKQGPFDLIFADPPYADVQSGSAPRTLTKVFAAGVLAEGARVVLEHASKTPPPSLSPLFLVQSRTYGDTQVSFYTPSTAEPEL